MMVTYPPPMFLAPSLTEIHLTGEVGMVPLQNPSFIVATNSFAPTSAVEPTWRLALCARKDRLLALKEGWDGPGSLPIRRELVEQADRIIQRFIGNLPDAEAPFLVPGGDGSLQIEWHRKNGELEMDLGVDGSPFIWVKDHNSGEEFEGNGEEALALFSRWAPRLAPLSDNASYVQGAPEEIDLTKGFEIYQNYTVS